MKVSLAAIVALAGLLGLSVCCCTTFHVTAARADDKPDPVAKIKQLEDKIAALEVTQSKLLEQVRELEFPELRPRDADEIRVLKLHVDAAKADYDRVHAFREAAATGGERVFLVGAAYRLAVARAELDWAEGRTRDAVQQCAEAVLYAQERARFLEITFRSGVAKIGMYTLSDDVRGGALEARARARIALLRAIAAAKSRKVDVSDLKIEVMPARGGKETVETRPLADVLKFLRETDELPEISGKKTK